MKLFLCFLKGEEFGDNATELGIKRAITGLLAWQATEAIATCIFSVNSCRENERWWKKYNI